MSAVGIEALNVYGGIAKLELKRLAAARNLDPNRFEKLLMREKSVVMPWEDIVSLAVNAAKPILAGMSETEQQQIELLIVCTESGIDFGKSASTYVHDYLGLGRHCRQFELKQACYAATAGFQMAVNFVLSQTAPNAKALVIATDSARFLPSAQRTAADAEWDYAEPSSGVGAVSFIVSNQPHLFQVDVGCSGYYGYEVMDFGRPVLDAEFVNIDLSLLSYLDCCEQSFRHYLTKVAEADYQQTFHYLVFHTPFGGMVKGAHQMMMRKFAPNRPELIRADFATRVAPGLHYCQQVGNIMGGTLYLALAGLIEQARLDEPKRVGLFSYGGGCCSEFFSGILLPQGQKRLAEMQIADRLAQRYPLTIEQYEQSLVGNQMVSFGTRNIKLEGNLLPDVYQQFVGSGLLMLREIRDYHRYYEEI
jgi:polyketide biosynthesis 3-hydroxy-3-methylglutaryl-CoA synthase-like enzyme PksG